MSARTVYATVPGKNGAQVRLGATLDASAGMVHVYRANGPALGLYRLERFNGSRLTERTLQALFSPAEASA